MSQASGEKKEQRSRSRSRTRSQTRGNSPGHFLSPRAPDPPTPPKPPPRYHSANPPVLVVGDSSLQLKNSKKRTTDCLQALQKEIGTGAIIKRFAGEGAKTITKHLKSMLGEGKANCVISMWHLNELFDNHRKLRGDVDIHQFDKLALELANVMLNFPSHAAVVGGTARLWQIDDRDAEAYDYWAERARRIFIDAGVHVVVDGVACFTDMERHDRWHMKNTWENQERMAEFIARLACAVMPPLKPNLPAFHVEAMGGPGDWSKHFFYWGKATQKKFQPELPPLRLAKSAKPDVQHLLEWLHLRLAERHLSKLLGPPDLRRDGWTRFEWLPNRDCVGDCVKQLARVGDRWVRAWHGSQLAALCSILHHERLFDSCRKDLGHRFDPGFPGVYCHLDATKNKAWPGGSYSHFVPIFGDGTFWGITWELLVDSWHWNKLRGDQCVQSASTMFIKALWVRGVTQEQLQAGDHVRFWNPEHEANPRCFGV